MKLGALLFVAATFALPIAAHAQEPLGLVVFRTAAKDAEHRRLAEALDPVVLAELDKIAGVKVTARPPLDLHATQLALDCIGETEACMRTVAEQAGAQALLSPSIERAGDETVVTLLYFDARSAGELRSSTRRQRGADVERGALDAVPAMLRELFGPAEAPAEPAPAPEPAEPAQAPAVSETDLAAEEPAASRTLFPPAPVAITAAGVVLAGVGVAFGLMAKADEDDYADAPTGNASEVDAANDTFGDAETKAVIANVGLGLGAAVTALGVTLWIIELSGDPEESSGAALAPELAPGHARLVLHGHL